MVNSRFERLRDLGFKIRAGDFTSKKSEPEILIAENFECEKMVQIKLYKMIKNATGS